MIYRIASSEKLCTISSLSTLLLLDPFRSWLMPFRNWLTIWTTPFKSWNSISSREQTSTIHWSSSWSRTFKMLKLTWPEQKIWSKVCWFPGETRFSPRSTSSLSTSNITDRLWLKRLYSENNSMRLMKHSSLNTMMLLTLLMRLFLFWTRFRTHPLSSLRNSRATCRKCRRREFGTELSRVPCLPPFSHWPPARTSLTRECWEKSSTCCKTSETRLLMPSTDWLLMRTKPSLTMRRELTNWMSN